MLPSLHGIVCIPPLMLIQWVALAEAVALLPVVADIGSHLMSVFHRSGSLWTCEVTDDVFELAWWILESIRSAESRLRCCVPLVLQARECLLLGGA